MSINDKERKEVTEAIEEEYLAEIEECCCRCCCCCDG